MRVVGVVRRLVIEYSLDKFSKAVVFRSVFARLGYPRVEMKRVDGSRVLRIHWGSLVFYEEDFPYLVARISRLGVRSRA